MKISFLFLVINTIFSRNIFANKKPIYNQFSLMTNRKKKLILMQTELYINAEKNIFHCFFKKVIDNKKFKNESNWYFVHLLTQNLKYIQKILNLTPNSMILKDTFVLYLNTNQLEKIKKFSLVKKLDPSDKFIEDAILIENTNFFQVITAPNQSIPSNNKFYKILSQDNGQIYIIEIVKNDISNQKILTNIKKDVINFLTSINSVKCVSTYIPPQIKNNINTGFTQKNYPPNQIIKDISTDIYYLPRYINEHGITGKDQIITIQDTPIDPYHAMFRDDNFGEIKINQYLNGHRKFVYYGSEKNSLSNVVLGMEENEHGTHIAGIASGKSICSNDNTKKNKLF